MFGLTGKVRFSSLLICLTWLLSGSPSVATENLPKRVISLAPHITEMIYSAGAGDHLIGVVEYSDFPEAAKTKPIVGNYHAVNIEKIIQLNPDIIYAWQGGSRPQDLERLQQLGFKIDYSKPESLHDIATEIRKIGKALGTGQIAEETAMKLEDELSRIRQAYQQKSKLTVFYQIWDRPLMTINGQHFISQALQYCGAENSFKSLPLLASEVNLESLLHKNPAVMLLGGDKATQQNWQQYWQQFPQLQAVKNRHVYLINADIYQRPTERFIMNIDALCRQIDQAR